MEKEEYLERRREEDSSGGTFWKVLGSAVLVAVAVAVVVSLPDIKRYIKINRM
ncbi:MAG: hypothetical protein WA584_20675 [Pyrinomonadaceae bacterium]